MRGVSRINYYKNIKIIPRHTTYLPSYRHKTFPTQISRKLLTTSALWVERKQNPQSARRNNVLGEQISRWFLLLLENISTSIYPGAARTADRGVLHAQHPLYLSPRAAPITAQRVGPFLPSSYP